MKSHTIKSAVFTRSGGGAITLASIQSAEVQDAGQLATRGGDGLSGHSLAFYEGGTVTARVVCSDLSFARTEGVTPPGDDLFPGAPGVLVIGFGEREQGKGFVAGAFDIQVTIGGTNECVVGPMADRAAFEGESSFSVDFTAVSIDGVTRPVAYALATIAQATAAVKAWTLKSASFTPNGGVATPITSLVSMEVRDEVNMNTRGSDGLEFHTLAWVDGQRVSGSINSHDMTFLTNAGLIPGGDGEMTIVFAEKKSGIGFVSPGGDLTVIIGASGGGDTCVLGGPQASGQHEGDPSVSFPFVAVSDDGVTRPLTYAIS